MSEESGAQGNPRVLADGLLSGRPPDPPPDTALIPVQDDQSVQQILSGESLEKPGSPISMDLQRQCKKMRRCVVSILNRKRRRVGVSYAKVLSTPGKGTPKDQIGLGESVCDPHKILVSDDDCVVDKSGKFPKIEFSERVHQQLDLAIWNVIIVRLLGRNIGYQTLLNRLHVVWKPMGEFQLIDLDNSYFLVRIEDPRDYRRILTEGPWTIYGSYLTVQPWSRSFSTSEKYPSKVVVWVRLPGLPYKYYSKALFRQIAAIVGDVVKVDYNTKVGERGKFARLAVTVDLNKPLIPCIGIDNFIQKLEYEGLHMICYKCGVYGHLQESCDGTDGSNWDPQNGLANSDKGKEIREDVNGGKDLFDPWITVDTRRKRGYNGASSSRGNGKSGNRNDTNHFAALTDDQTVTMEEQATTIVIEAGEVSPRRNPSKAVQVGAEKLIGNGLMQKKIAGSVSDNSDKGGAFEKAVILPMVEGQHVQVVAQSPAGVDKGHAAVSLLEKGHGKSATEVVVLGRGRGGKKGGQEGLHQGLKVRKPPDTRTTSRALLNEWVEGVHNQLTAIAEQSAIDPGGSIRAGVNQEGKLVPSGSILTGIGVRTNVSGVESDGVTDGSVADH
ncbi:hypothetical protein GQ457_12G006080 [Hibiscus cannabinus]